jgi:hypothetical protein
MVMVTTPVAVRPGEDLWRTSARQTMMANETNTRITDMFLRKVEVMHEDGEDRRKA